MLHHFKKLMSSFSDSAAEPEIIADQVNLAAAVLLVEVMMADHEVKQEEISQITNILEGLFGIEKDKSVTLIEEACEKHHELVSLHEMTSIVNEQQDQQLKRKLVFAMWCIAFADKDKDKYEEHLIRKVADLLYLSHSDFIKARHEAEAKCAQG